MTESITNQDCVAVPNHNSIIMNLKEKWILKSKMVLLRCYGEQIFLTDISKYLIFFVMQLSIYLINVERLQENEGKNIRENSKSQYESKQQKQRYCNYYRKSETSQKYIWRPGCDQDIVLKGKTLKSRLHRSQRKWSLFTLTSWCCRSPQGSILPKKETVTST
jgi:hypothetical protein